MQNTVKTLSHSIVISLASLILTSQISEHSLFISSSS